MKQVLTLNEGWEIKDFTPAKNVTEGWRQALADSSGEWLSARMPSVVQEVLWAHDRLDQTVLETGEADACRWVSDRDWAFRCPLPLQKAEGRAFLNFKGLDTLADIVLNGKRIAWCESSYKPTRVEITGLLEKENQLLLYFHAPCTYFAQLAERIPPEQRDRLGPMALLRKGHGDFSSHAGVIPYFTPIGVYDDIELIFVPEAELTYVDVDTSFAVDRSQAFITIRAQITSAQPAPTRLRATLFDPDGAEAACAQGEGMLRLILNQPRLWWPRNYGEQPLYRLKTDLLLDGQPVDTDEKTLGLREVAEVGPLRYLVNGVRIRLWGSCIVPMWGPSHRYQPLRAETLLNLAENANINAFRIWGPSQQYSDALYDEMDSRGILIWQDFPVVGAHLPEDAAFVDCVVSEAGAMIRRLKHHACILHWCGGNESVYMCDLFQKDDRIRLGHDLIYYRLREICQAMDPRRVYRISSPFGGAYPNETSIDSHGSRAALSFLPEEAYANFFSENIRTFVPELKSLERFIPGDQLWPENWRDHTAYGHNECIPPAWLRRTINHWPEKAGPFERFYDADNPGELVYKFNAAAVYDLRLILNASRRGKSAAHANEERRTYGHLLWKFTTAWPQIYCALVDYYMEPGQPYYALRRAYAPVQVSIDVDGRVYLWGVNDTREDFRGSLEVTVYDLKTENIFMRRRYAAAIVSGEAQILANLDEIGQFWFTCVVFAKLLDEAGNEISRDFQYMKCERYLSFPDARLTLEDDGNGRVRIAADRFARCVELGGDENGDRFGWYFEDNYFDLMPGEVRTLNVSGRHSKGIVTARAHYSSQTATLLWRP